MSQKILAVTMCYLLIVNCQGPASISVAPNANIPVASQAAKQTAATIAAQGPLPPVFSLANLTVKQVSVNINGVGSSESYVYQPEVSFSDGSDPNNPTVDNTPDTYLLRLCAANSNDCLQASTSGAAVSFYGRDVQNQIASVSACVYAARAPQGASPNASFEGTDLYCGPEANSDSTGTVDTSQETNTAPMRGLLNQLWQVRSNLDTNLRSFYRQLAAYVKGCESNPSDTSCNSSNLASVAAVVGAGEQQFVETALASMTKSANSQIDTQTATATDVESSLDTMTEALGLIDTGSVVNTLFSGQTTASILVFVGLASSFLVAGGLTAVAIQQKKLAKLKADRNSRPTEDFHVRVVRAEAVPTPTKVQGAPPPPRRPRPTVDAVVGDGTPSVNAPARRTTQVTVNGEVKTVARPSKPVPPPPPRDGARRAVQADGSIAPRLPTTPPPAHPPLPRTPPPLPRTPPPLPRTPPPQRVELLVDASTTLDDLLNQGMGSALPIFQQGQAIGVQIQTLGGP